VSAGEDLPGELQLRRAGVVVTTSGAASASAALGGLLFVVSLLVCALASSILPATGSADQAGLGLFAAAIIVLGGWATAGVLAIILGVVSLGQIRRSEGRRQGFGRARLGITLGGIGPIIGALLGAALGVPFRA
jgi:hypothetical protein